MKEAKKEKETENSETQKEETASDKKIPEKKKAKISVKTKNTKKK